MMLYDTHGRMLEPDYGPFAFISHNGLYAVEFGPPPAEHIIRYYGPIQLTTYPAPPPTYAPLMSDDATWLDRAFRAQFLPTDSRLTTEEAPS